jgi:hypothetical protein
VIASLITSLLGITPDDQPGVVIKAWIEYSVDTYWTRHTIASGRSLEAIARKWQREHRGVTLDCIGLYDGPKIAGDMPDNSDIIFMAGYRGNPGRVLYFNGAKPINE